MICLDKDERIDNLHINNYFIIQNTKKFCFGIDAVLLANLSRIEDKDIVMDIGTGTGIIPILIAAKTKALKIDAIEVQEDMVLMAKKSVKLNNLANMINIEHCDVKNVLTKFKANFYDVITVNPPYIKNKGGLLCNLNSKSIARHEILCTFEDIAKYSSKLLKNNGRMYIIHRVDRLSDIIFTLKKYNLEPKQLQFIQSYSYKEPTLFIIEAIKNANSSLKIKKNLIIYEEKGKYTKEVLKIYYNI